MSMNGRISLGWAIDASGIERSIERSGYGGIEGSFVFPLKFDRLRNMWRGEHVTGRSSRVAALV
jgi:hypothetical protein